MGDLQGTYRFKRQEDGGSNNGFLNLFDRLAEKINVVEKTEDEEIGNYTCVLRHLWYLDHNNDLDLHAMINRRETHMAKIQFFFKCLSKEGIETCMRHDIRAQIE